MRACRRVILNCGNSWPIRLDTPGEGLFQDLRECAGRKRRRAIGIRLGEPNHFTNLVDDLSEWQAALLSGRYRRSYGNTERIDERNELFVALGDEIVG